MKRNRIGFLYLGQTHEDYPDIVHCLSGHGIESQLIDLNSCDQVTWTDYGSINVRECRGYHSQPDFLPRIDALEKNLGDVPMVNSFAVVRAAIDKANYLRGLEMEGVDIIPTLWLKLY